MSELNKLGEELYQDFLLDHSILYNVDKKGYIEKLIVDFFDVDNCEFNLFHGDEGNRFQLSLIDKEQDDSKLLEKVSESISSYDVNVNYVDLMVQEVRDFYTVYQESSIYVGQFGFGIKNFEGIQKIVVKTNIEEMLERLEILGYSLDKGKFLVENKISRKIEDDLLEKEINNENIVQIPIFESEEIFDEDENSKEKGPVLSKKLGEMPTSNSAGFVNYFNLALFLTVDIVSILIGLYLLMR